MQGCGEYKLVALAAGLSCLQLVIEWALGERAKRFGGPASIAALLAIGFIGVFSFLRARARGYKK